MLKTYLGVMLGGAIGTGLRMWMSSALAARYGETFPIGTLAVNVLGCFVIGVVATVTGPEGVYFTSPFMRQFLMIGVLGGYTTFSSFGLQTMTLLQDGEWFRASLNVILSVFLCLVAVRLGMVVATLFNQR
jgi:CrcB protein